MCIAPSLMFFLPHPLPPLLLPIHTHTLTLPPIHKIPVLDHALALLSFVLQNWTGNDREKITGLDEEKRKKTQTKAPQKSRTPNAYNLFVKDFFKTMGTVFTFSLRFTPSPLRISEVIIKVLKVICFSFSSIIIKPVASLTGLSPSPTRLSRLTSTAPIRDNGCLYLYF